MLCIALVVVFALDLAEAASPCANAECSAACDIGGCDDTDENGAPCAQHHCCHGTTASDPTIKAAIAVRTTMTAGASWREVFVASGYLETLERPPRAATVI